MSPKLLPTTFFRIACYLTLLTGTGVSLAAEETAQGSITESSVTDTTSEGIIETDTNASATDDSPADGNLLSNGAVAESKTAAQANSKPYPPMSGEITVTGESHRGNTKSDSIYGTALLNKETRRWRNTFEAKGKNASKDDQRTDEKYNARLQSDYKLENSRNYLFAVWTYEVDKFDGYKYQSSFALGVGRQFIDTPRHKLRGELGPGYRRVHEEAEADAKESAMLRAVIDYKWLLSDATTFSETIIEEVDDRDTTISQAITALESRINGSLYLKLSHEIKHTSPVPAGTDKTESQALISLNYKF